MGAFVFCFGIFILASAVKIRNIFGESDLENFWDHFPLTCQYWAGIPVITFATLHSRFATRIKSFRYTTKGRDKTLKLNGGTETENGN